MKYQTFYIILGRHKNKGFKKLNQQIRHAHWLDLLIAFRICSGYDLISF